MPMHITRNIPVSVENVNVLHCLKGIGGTNPVKSHIKAFIQPKYPRGLLGLKGSFPVKSRKSTTVAH